MICYVASHNFFKPRIIRSRRNQTTEKHSDQLKLDTGLITILKSLIFTCRMSITKITLPEYFRDIWFKRTGTPLNKCAGYVPKYVFI